MEINEFEKSIAKLIVYNNVTIIKLLLENKYLSYDLFFEISKGIFDYKIKKRFQHLYLADKGMMPKIIINSIPTLIEEYRDDDTIQYLLTKLIKSLKKETIKEKNNAIPTIRKLIELGGEISPKIIIHAPTDIFLENATPEMFLEYNSFKKCVRYANEEISNWLIDKIKKQYLQYDLINVITMPEYYNNKIIFHHYLQDLESDLLNLVIFNVICKEYMINLSWIPKNLVINDHLLLIIHILKRNSSINNKLNFNDDVRVIVSQNVCTFEYYSKIYQITYENPFSMEEYNKYIGYADIILQFLSDEIYTNGLGAKEFDNDK